MALSDLLTSPTKESIKTTILNNLQSLGFPPNNWSDYSVPKRLIDAFSEVIFAYSSQVSDIAKMGLLNYSTGNWLAEMGSSNYGVIKNSGTRTRRILRITDSLGTITPITCSPNTLWIKDNSGRKFVNYASITIPKNSYVDVVFIAETIGSTYNSVSSGYNFITSKQGCVISEPSVNIQVYGTDVESDNSYRRRIISRINAIGDGINEAKFAVWAQDINSQISQTSVVNGYYQNSSIPGSFTMYITNEGRTNFTSNELLAVKTGLATKIPACLLIDVQNAVVNKINIIGTITVPALQLDNASTLGLSALADFQNSLEIGGLVDYQVVLSKLLTGCNSEVSVSISSPSSDVQLAQNEVVSFDTTALTFVGV